MYRLAGAPLGAATLGNVAVGSGCTEVAREVAAPPFVWRGVPLRGRGLGALVGFVIAGDWRGELVNCDWGFVKGRLVDGRVDWC